MMANPPASTLEADLPKVLRVVPFTTASAHEALAAEAETLRSLDTVVRFIIGRHTQAGSIELPVGRLDLSLLPTLPEELDSMA
jgi:hypothetical protein